jgi:hypothetical protein
LQLDVSKPTTSTLADVGVPLKIVIEKGVVGFLLKVGSKPEIMLKEQERRMLFFYWLKKHRKVLKLMVHKLWNCIARMQFPGTLLSKSMMLFCAGLRNITFRVEF